jgi:predicted transcriptional regulator
MKKIPRRNKMKIYNDLLSILEAENNKEIVLTHLQLRLKVPFDRLKQYLNQLKELDLIEDETSLKLTKKGKQYLRDYKKVLDWMRRIGLEYK